MEEDNNLMIELTENLKKEIKLYYRIHFEKLLDKSQIEDYEKDFFFLISIIENLDLEEYNNIFKDKLPLIYSNGVYSLNNVVFKNIYIEFKQKLAEKTSRFSFLNEDCQSRFLFSHISLSDNIQIYRNNLRDSNVAVSKISNNILKLMIFNFDLLYNNNDFYNKNSSCNIDWFTEFNKEAIVSREFKTSNIDKHLKNDDNIILKYLDNNKLLLISPFKIYENSNILLFDSNNLNILKHCSFKECSKVYVIIFNNYIYLFYNNEWIIMDFNLNIVEISNQVIVDFLNILCKENFQTIKQYNNRLFIQYGKAIRVFDLEDLTFVTEFKYKYNLKYFNVFDKNILHVFLHEKGRFIVNLNTGEKIKNKDILFAILTKFVLKN